MGRSVHPVVSPSARGSSEAQGTSAVNRNSPVPLHHQMRGYLLGLIDRGELAPGQQVVRERELAEHFGISLAPVRQAILDLVREGYLYRVRGRGTFVREPKVEQKISILSSFKQSMEGTSLTPEMRIIEQRKLPTPDALRNALATADREVVVLRRVALVDGEPIAVLSAFLPIRLVPGLESLVLTNGSLYQTLEQEYGIILARADSAIEVASCRTPDAALLSLPVGTPVLQVEGMTYDVIGQGVEYSRVIYRADRFRFTMESFRRSPMDTLCDCSTPKNLTCAPQSRPSTGLPLPLPQTSYFRREPALPDRTAY